MADDNTLLLCHTDHVDKIPVKGALTADLVVHFLVEMVVHFLMVIYINELKSRFNFDGMTLLADREYIGLQWFEELRLVLGLNFIIRIKKGIYYSHVNDAPGASQKDLLAKLRRCKRKNHVSKRIVLGGAYYYYIVVRNPKADHQDEDEFVFLLTSWFNRTAAVAAYLRRWSIEVTFRHLKSNGFNLESLRLEGRAKREMMMAMLSVVFALCVIEGRKFYQRHPQSRQVKTDHQRGCKTLVHSVFRQGLNRVMATFTSLSKLVRRLGQIYRRGPVPEWAFV